MKQDLLWTAESVIRAVRGHSLHEQNWTAHGVAIDSRTTVAGDLFIALKGPTHDGHDHVSKAFAAGAVAAIVSRQPSNVPPDAPVIVCQDTFLALQQLGEAGRERATAKIVAVTGSVGKTGTKEMLRLMLGALSATYANEGSLNNHWGVPLSLARLPADAHYGVFELGMNHAGELSVLSQQVRPDIALITTIEAVHLEFFASLEAIADAKAEIFFGMKPDGTVILNRDNKQFARLAAAAKHHKLKKIFSFGRDAKADAHLLDCVAIPEGSRIRAEVLGDKIEYVLSVPGEHLALNSLGALLAAVTAGGDLRACAAALAHYQIPKGRGVMHKLPWHDGRITLIDESYNASPAAVRAALKILDSMAPEGNGRKILVLGDMRELGVNAEALHLEVAKVIADSGIDLVFCCGEMMKRLYDALPETQRGGHAASSVALAIPIRNELHNGDIVTIKGSLSTNMKCVVDVLKAASDKQFVEKKLA